jgi:hypothetical protein
MPRLQAPIMIVLYEVVVGVARKGQWIEPERVNWSGHFRQEPWARCKKVLNIMAKYIVADDMLGFPQRLFKLVEPSPDIAFRGDKGGPIPKPYRRHVEYLTRLGIDLKIHRQTTLQ